MRLSALGVLALCISCRASAHGGTGEKTQAEAKREAFAEMGERGVEDGQGGVNDFSVEPTQTSADRGALLGARHDVFLNGDQPLACRCLSAVAAQPEDPRLGWETDKPSISAAGQLVVAFQSAPCSGAPDGALGASYRGYKKSDADVIVMIEEAKPGRPAISGAIIPKPSGGKLLVEPVPAALPWGQALVDGSGLCSVSF